MQKTRLAVLLGTLTLLQTGNTPATAAPESVDLTILGTADVHAHVWPTDYYTDADKPLGLAKIHTLVKQLRAENPHTLLVDAGDTFQGSPLADVHSKLKPGDRPNPLIQAMNAMGYDAMELGNHDFNYGLDYLKQAQAEAKFPLLATNMTWADSGKPCFAPYVIKEVAGVKVGLVGFATPGIMLWDKQNLEGKVLTQDMVASAQRWVPELKKQGCDVIVALPHSGLGGKYGPAYAGYPESSGLPPENVGLLMARSCPQIDVLFAAHTHQDVASELIDGVACVQAGKWAERLAVAKLRLEKAGGRWKVVSKSTQTRQLTDVAPAPEILAATQAAHDATLRYVGSAIATTPHPWSAAMATVEDTPILDLVNQVQAEASGAQLSAAACFNTETTFGPGPITVASLARLYPYENILLAISITGKKLRQYLEWTVRYYAPYAPGPVAFDPDVRGYNYDMIAGVDYRIDRSRPVGERIVELRYQGKPVTDDQTFTMALNSYRATGGEGYDMLRDCPVVYNRQESIRDLLIDYLKRKGTIEPADVFQKNWELLPAQETR